MSPNIPEVEFDLKSNHLHMKSKCCNFYFTFVLKKLMLVPIREENTSLFCKVNKDIFLWILNELFGMGDFVLTYRMAGELNSMPANHIIQRMYNR